MSAKKFLSLWSGCGPGSGEISVSVNYSATGETSQIQTERKYQAKFGIISHFNPTRSWI